MGLRAGQPRAAADAFTEEDPAVDHRFVPGREHQELPHQEVRRPIALEKPAKEERQALRIQQAAPKRLALGQSPNPLRQGFALPEVLEPGNAEAPLAVGQDALRKAGSDGVAQERLGSAIAPQRPRRQRGRALDQAVVQEGDTAFDRRSHRHSIVPVQDRVEEGVLVAEHRLPHRLARVERRGFFHDPQPIAERGIVEMDAEGREVAREERRTR